MKLRRPKPPEPGEINHGAFDRFTLVHAAIGAGYALLGLGLGWVVALAILWELAEDTLKAYAPWTFPNATGDTLRNAVVDTLAVIAGWALALRVLGA